MEQANVQFIVVNENHIDEWVERGLIAHREVIYTQQFINIYLISFDIDNITLLFAEDTYSELSIIIVRHSKKIAWRMLLDLFAFDEVFFVAADNFFEEFDVGL